MSVDNTPPMDIKLFDEARTLGTRVVGEAGTGKSAFMAWLAFSDCVRNIPMVAWDHNGGLVDNFFKLVETSQYREQIRPRIRYVELGNPTFAYGMPFYYDAGDGDCYSMSQRIVDIMIKLDPNLKSAPVLGESSLTQIGTAVGMILSSIVDEQGNRWQVTEAMDLLENYKSPRWLRQFERVKPKAAKAVDFFKQSFDQWRANEQRERYYAFETRIRQYINSPTLRAMVGQGKPTIDWAQVDRDNLAVIFDFRRLKDKVPLEHLSILTFDSFLEYVHSRGVTAQKPISMFIDELPALLEYQSIEPDIRNLSARFRAYKLWPTIGHQALYQLSDSLRQSAWGFRNQIIGQQANIRDAEDVMRNLLSPPEELLPEMAGAVQQLRARMFFVKRHYNEGVPDTKVRIVAKTPDLEALAPGKVTNDQVAAAKLRNQRAFAPRVADVLAQIDARLGSGEPPAQKKPKA